MKMLLVSVILFATTLSQAQNEGTPIYAKLNLETVTRNMSTINPRFNLVSASNLTFNSRLIELTLEKRMPTCASGMMCIQMMPAPLKVKLPVVEVVNTGCSIRYIAKTITEMAGVVQEEIVIEDYSHSTCEFVLKAIGTVTYSATGISSLTKAPETATAQFFVNGEFVRTAN